MEDHASLVRRPAGVRVVPWIEGQSPCRARPEVEDEQVVVGRRRRAVTIEQQRRPSRAQQRPEVAVGALEQLSDLTRRESEELDAVMVFDPRVVEDCGPVVIPGRPTHRFRIPGQLPRRRSVGCRRPGLPPAGAIGDEGDGPPVGGPARLPVARPGRRESDDRSVLGGRRGVLRVRRLPEAQSGQHEQRDSIWDRAVVQSCRPGRESPRGYALVNASSSASSMSKLA